ncbi:hypothetical protein BDZ90DRAFT_255257 [Jaminaea rosea]|uniref:Roadblock/LAMTOR2 domain-containing protein n=1 Tax=Jaminaea rosea TaxID=1569628 RepID=A0A316UMC5_9BASI|nr:hypothetical protein BDZ90DRAFT_255257 [Jaminaea rosea]PWN25531.1 hypothetical protein BDZ90DRAFT_255257 [Jaminaea rosea]
MSLSPSSSSGSPSLHARMDPSSLAAKPHNLSTSPPPPGSPMPPAASLASRAEEASTPSASSPSTAAQAFAASSSSQPAPPPEVEATLSKLTSHKNVTGCLILSRPDALIIRAGGRDFEPSGPGAHDRSERLRRIVKLVRQSMDTLSAGVGGVDEGDEVGFVRIRTKRYEMMISPSDKYLLVVLQDPTIAP